MSAANHTCGSGGRSNCEPCMRFEVELWDAINRYAAAVGGDPASHAHGNEARMRAVADVGAVVRAALEERQTPKTAPPTNPNCQGVVGTIGACGHDGYYCSDLCWTIGQLVAARRRAAEYERRLGISGVSREVRR